MRDIRLSGSEGGGTLLGSPYPYRPFGYIVHSQPMTHVSQLLPHDLDGAGESSWSIQHAGRHNAQKLILSKSLKQRRRQVVLSAGKSL